MARDLPFRGNIIQMLGLLSSEDQQLEYERNVPYVDITVELVCMWFDDQYHPDSAEFASNFTPAELAMLDEFNLFFDERLERLPESLGTVRTWLDTTDWREVMAEARNVLGKLSNILAPPGTAGRMLPHSSERGQPFGLAGEWFALGIVTDDLVAEMRSEWARGEDRNPEHFRYRAFTEFLAGPRVLSPELVARLYTLGETDPDPAMGHAMLFDLVARPDCPSEIRARAVASGERALSKLVRRLELLQELAGGLTSDLFARALAGNDPEVHRRLVELDGLTMSQVDQLAKHGATRAIRNLADVRSRRGR